MLELTLTPKKSELNNLTLYETIDEKILNKLINSDLLLTNKWDDSIYENEKQQLKAYQKIVKNGTAKVKYNKVDKMPFGRSNPNKSLGLFSLRRGIRHTLSKNNYTDIDIENCHPNILLQISKYNKIVCTNLEDYVKNRNTHLNNIMTNYDVSKDEAKKLFIRILYFGSFKNWAKDLGIEKDETEFIKNFKNEIQKIGKIIYDNNDEIKKTVEDRKEDQNKKNYNKYGSVVSYYLQEYEIRILESIYSYCLDNNYIQNQNCVLCADGLMIEKRLFKNDLLDTFNKLILEKFQLDLKFTTKEMSEDYLDVLDDHIINTFKKYEPLLNIPDIEIVKFNNKYVYDKNITTTQFTPEIFNKYKTIILKSTTGTGKTSNIAKFCKNSNKKVLSIITRISLVNQHVQSFKNENIHLVDYRSKDNIFNENLVICINSLMMLDRLDDYEMKNYIIYIDEISSFIETLTHNTNLNTNLKLINNILMRLIKNCHKLVVSDALISDNVFELLKFRDNKDKIFLINEFSKYKDIKAYDIKDETNFLSTINDRCLKDEYFLFGCDSKTIITQYYHYCLEHNEDKKDKFVLITSDTKIEFDDANEYFKNKFVFYSPSITFGIDFSIDTPQDVFIFINGNSILPSGSFQQTTRTRNIKNLYFYVNQKNRDLKYNNLDEVKKYYNEFITENNELLNMSSFLDENDNLKVIENTFFNLYCYNEYVKNIYETNKYLHYKEILKENNFDIIGDDEKNIKLSKELKEEMKGYNDIEELINSYIEDENKDNNKYSMINEFKNLFGIIDDDLVKFKNYIGDKYKIDDVLNFNRFMKKDEVIDRKINTFNDNTYNIKSIENIYHKIKFVNQIFKNNKLDHFELDKIKDFKINDKEYNLCKKYFRTSMKKPTNDFECKKMVMNWYKNLFGESIITSKIDKRRNGDKIIRDYQYNVNNELINEYLEIVKNLNKKDTKDIYIKKFNMKIDENTNLFIED